MMQPNSAVVEQGAILAATAIIHSVFLGNIPRSP